MFTGKRFQLMRSVLALDGARGRRDWITVPLGAIVTVVSGPHGGGDGRIADVLWDGRPLGMFAKDLKSDAIEITDHTAQAG
jgi:hypothetical protein